MTEEQSGEEKKEEGESDQGEALQPKEGEQDKVKAACAIENKASILVEAARKELDPEKRLMLYQAAAREYNKAARLYEEAGMQVEAKLAKKKEWIILAEQQNLK